MTDPIELPTPRLRVVTREVAAVDDVLAYAELSNPTYWSRRGDAMAAYGETTAFTRIGPAIGFDFGRQWRALAAAADVDDAVGLPGTGLVAFGAFAFDPLSPTPSRLSVPAVVVGRRGDRSWVTRISHAGAIESEPGVALPESTGYGPYWAATLGPGALDPSGYQAAVRRGLDAIADGEVSKVVLARDLAGSVPPGSDLRRLVRALASGYPDCWAYAVDGLMGASPETLVTVSGGTVTARVLAGTAPRGADADADTAASLALATSAKDQDEHLYAVQSVLASLRPHTSVLAASEQPFALKLPNVFHLATDVEGELSGGASALDLVAALHPTAAVAGTPTDAALEVIRRLEPFDRGRYAGPVGWVDAHGDGEWAIALRCAQFDLNTVSPGGTGDIPLRAHAGAGIVAGSDPEAELLETRVKFRPIVDALA
ncbi:MULTISPECIES: isochorismate synthase [unclassified Microbacterium]|uniref:isochorismate synthase n=1 Tax=unclassified Microbacterium TaxID=2609290 RepID=UPI00214B2BAF|nr:MULTISPECIES: isochorismate synthase [unclassified Microbacterium]MCR2810812.1 isochorismate synthase [Microbacterium sp. zg.B185]WIM19781.1 isochorismate synthase [Microbacterium sp. zg-B185]